MAGVQLAKHCFQIGYITYVFIAYIINENFSSRFIATPSPSIPESGRKWQKGLDRVSVLSSKIWKNKLCNLQLGKRKINTPKPPTGGIKKVINHYQININSIYWIFCNGNSKISHWKNNCYCHNHLHQNKNSCFQKCMKTFHCIGEFIPCWGVLDYVSRFSSKDSSSQLGLYQLWITLAIATLT